MLLLVVPCWLIALVAIFLVCFESGIWQSILFHTRDRLARAFKSGRAGRDLCAGKIARGKVARSAGALLILGRFFVVVCCVEGKTRAGFVVFKKECFIFAQR